MQNVQGNGSAASVQLLVTCSSTVAGDSASYLAGRFPQHVVASDGFSQAALGAVLRGLMEQLGRSVAVVTSDLPGQVRKLRSSFFGAGWNQSRQSRGASC